MHPLGQQRALSPDPTGSGKKRARNNFDEDSTNPESLALLQTDRIVHTDSGGDGMMRGTGNRTEDEQGSSTTPGNFQSFIINNSTFNDIQGDYYSLDISNEYEEVWRKIDIWIMPTVCLICFASSWDSYRLCMRNDQYYYIALTLSAFCYISAALSSNLFLKTRVTAKLMLSTIFSLWGIMVTLQGLSTNYRALLVCRFFLGLLEGGLLPSLILYLSRFYPRAELQLRVSAWFTCLGLSYAMNDILVKSKLGNQVWAWIFFFHGIVAFLLGITSYFILPSSPSHLSPLSEGQKAYVEIKLKEDWNSEDIDNSFSWQGAWRTLIPPQVLIAAVVLFFVGTIFQSLEYLLPPIYYYQRIGIQGIRPLFVIAISFLQVLSYISDHCYCRGVVSIISSLLFMTGLAILMGSNASVAQYVSMLFLITGAYCTAATMFTWMASNATPYARRAAVIAIGSFTSKLGGISIMWLFGPPSRSAYQRDAPTLKVTLLAISVFMAIFSFLNLLYLRRQNRRKRAIQLTMSRDQEQPGLGDGSSWFEYNL